MVSGPWRYLPWLCQWRLNPGASQLCPCVRLGTDLEFVLCVPAHQLIAITPSPGSLLAMHRRTRYSALSSRNSYPNLCLRSIELFIRPNFESAMAQYQTLLWCFWYLQREGSSRIIMRSIKCSNYIGLMDVMYIWQRNMCFKAGLNLLVLWDLVRCSFFLSPLFFLGLLLLCVCYDNN